MTLKTLTLEHAFLDKVALYLSYMPFIKGGGLFIRTPPVFSIGSWVNLHIKLLQEVEPHCITGKVIWITPQTAQGNKFPGIGVQLLGENSDYLVNKIETYLADMLKSSQITDTL